jgi:competence protein ComGF
VNVGTLYEISGISVTTITIIWIIKSWRKQKDKADPLISIFLVGLFFGLGWEPQGTGVIWSYQGFNLYPFMGIPLVIILDWSWAMIICHLLSKQITQLSKLAGSVRDHWIITEMSFFLSGALMALIVEPIFVSLGMWQYHYVGEKAVLDFTLLNVRLNLAVIIGWGMLTTINLTLSGKTAESLATRLTQAFHLPHPAALVASSSSIGLFSGWLSWQLSVLFTALTENVKPRIFFTRDHIIELDWITNTQLVIILIIATGLAVYIWRPRRAIVHSDRETLSKAQSNT